MNGGTVKREEACDLYSRHLYVLRFLWQEGGFSICPLQRWLGGKTCDRVSQGWEHFTPVVMLLTVQGFSQCYVVIVVLKLVCFSSFHFYVS